MIPKWPQNLFKIEPGGALEATWEPPLKQGASKTSICMILVPFRARLAPRRKPKSVQILRTVVKFGLFAIVLDFFDRVPTILMWIYSWGDTAAWAIKIGQKANLRIFFDHLTFMCFSSLVPNLLLLNVDAAITCVFVLTVFPRCALVVLIMCFIFSALYLVFHNLYLVEITRHGLKP